MNRIILLAVVAASFFTGGAASASPATCAGGTLADYLAAGFSCQSDSLVFSNFAYDSSGSTPNGEAVPAESINLVPVFTPGNEGFQISTGFGVSSFGNPSVRVTQKGKITFRVTAAGAAIDRLDLFFNGSKNDPPFSGNSRVDETYCLEHTLSDCASPATFSVTNPPFLPNSSVTFARVGMLEAALDIIADSGTSASGGSSQISQVEFSVDNVASTVPEPATLTLLGFSLTGLGMVRRRKTA